MTTKQQDAVIEGLSHAHGGRTLAVESLEDSAVRVTIPGTHPVRIGYTIDRWGGITSWGSDRKEH